MKFHKTCGGYCVILRDCEGVCFDMGQYIYILKIVTICSKIIV
jgi:hypothetical protein